MTRALVEQVEMAIRDAIYDQFGVLHTDGDCRAAQAAIALICDSGRPPQGGDNSLAPGEAGQSGGSASERIAKPPTKEPDHGQ